jgi:hypothetical protein
MQTNQSYRPDYLLHLPLPLPLAQLYVRVQTTRSKGRNATTSRSLLLEATSLPLCLFLPMSPSGAAAKLAEMNRAWC